MSRFSGLPPPPPVADNAHLTCLMELYLTARDTLPRSWLARIYLTQRANASPTPFLRGFVPLRILLTPAARGSSILFKFTSAVRKIVLTVVLALFSFPFFFAHRHVRCSLLA